MGTAQDPELLARAVRNPGRLILAPTTVTGGFPWGGKSLGFTRGMRCEFEVRYQRIYDPSSGVLVKVVRRRVEFPVLGCLLEGPAWDPDVLAALASQSTPSTGLAVQQPPETRLEGTLIPAEVPAWQKLLFVSDDPQGACAVIRRPVPLIDLSQAIEFAAKRKCGFPVRFAPTPDSAWASTPFWQIARRENLTL